MSKGRRYVRIRQKVIGGRFGKGDRAIGKNSLIKCNMTRYNDLSSGKLKTSEPMMKSRVA